VRCVLKGRKILLVGLIVLIVIATVGISATVGWRPFLGPEARPLTARQFERTPQRLERGRYLLEGVTPCLDCHSVQDWNTHGAPKVPGTVGAGQLMPVPDLPGRVVAPNLTPDPETGAGKWTDDQLARAIREGIGHDGRALFPFMPYPKFRTMSDEDLASVIVYLRSLAAVRNPLPATEIAFPVKYLMRSAPEPITAPVNGPDPADPVKQGEYLVTIAGCGTCHTPQERGQPMAELELGGGFVMRGPWGEVATANITPDASGISYYDESLFVQSMRTGYVKARKLSSIMPFGLYSHMSDNDLKSIYAYLRTVKPVKHRVDNNEPPTYCKICRMKHGGGEAN
jgi:mono/diheme cytochrome c family protein